MNTIAIDCGASFIKGALIKDSTILQKAQEHSPHVHMTGSILQPTQITALIPLIKKMIQNLAGDEKEVLLCISNEMHGFILAYSDGAPFTDYISWQKEYGNIAVFEKTAMQILSDEQFTDDVLYSGMSLRAGLPSCNLNYLWRCGHLDEVSSKLHFYTLGDYIIRAISGIEPICHPTNAAATGLLDLRSGEWNLELIKATGGENIVFPRIGEESCSFALGRLHIIALPAIGDQQAALLGARLQYETDISFNLGTGAQVSKLVKKPVFGENYQIRPFFNGLYLKTIPHLPSGRALNVFFRFFKNVIEKMGMTVTDEHLWDVLIKTGNPKSKSNLRCDLSFFENPITKNSTGSITNIEEFGFIFDELVNSIFEQMSNNFLWAASMIEPDESNVRRIVFSGGIARRIETIRQRILNSYNKDTPVVVSSDETLLGLYIYGVLISKV